MSDSVFLPAERVFSVWSRNALVWRKSALRSLLGTFSDPLLYLLALGYGLGQIGRAHV